MTKKQYEKTMLFFGNHPQLRRFLVIVGKSITIAIYIFYPLFLIMLLLTEFNTFLKAALVPLISLIVISIIRRVINAPRPYEVYETPPLYDKKTSGLSFPSRHSFCVFIIGFSVISVSLPTGIAILLLGVVLAADRVLCGVHFIKDVVAGFLFAVLSAVVGFIII